MASHSTTPAPLIAIVALVAACTAGNEAPRTDAAAASTVVTLTATDYAFEAPDTIPAGFTTFRLVNNSEQFHMAQLIKLEGGRTLDDFLKAYSEAFRTVGPRPEWAKRLGGPGGAEPHGGSNATLHLEPGSYAWICLMNPPPDRVPHVMKGMARPFVVRADGATWAWAMDHTPKSWRPTRPARQDSHYQETVTRSALQIGRSRLQPGHKSAY